MDTSRCEKRPGAVCLRCLLGAAHGTLAQRIGGRPLPSRLPGWPRPCMLLNTRPTCRCTPTKPYATLSYRYVAELQSLKGVLLAAAAEQEALEKRVAEVGCTRCCYCLLGARAVAVTRWVQQEALEERKDGGTLLLPRARPLVRGILACCCPFNHSTQPLPSLVPSLLLHPTAAGLGEQQAAVPGPPPQACGCRERREAGGAASQQVSGSSPLCRGADGRVHVCPPG